MFLFVFDPIHKVFITPDTGHLYWDAASGTEGPGDDGE